MSCRGKCCSMPSRKLRWPGFPLNHLARLGQVHLPPIVTLPIVSMSRSEDTARNASWLLDRELLLHENATSSRSTRRRHTTTPRRDGSTDYYYYYCRTLAKEGPRRYIVLDGEELEAEVFEHDQQASEDEISRVQQDRMKQYKYHHQSPAPPPPPAISPDERATNIGEAEIWLLAYKALMDPAREAIFGPGLIAFQSVAHAQSSTFSFQSVYYPHLYLPHGSLHRQRLHRRHQTTAPVAGHDSKLRSGGYSLRPIGQT